MADAPVVAVRGEAYQEVAPELARFTVTAVARDRDRETTLTRLAERAAAVRALLDAAGPVVQGRETGQVNVWPVTKRSGDRMVAYQGRVSTTVTVTDFTALGELMLRLADHEQVEVAGPVWSLRPDSPAYRAARHAAIADALARAREYAEALGARVTALRELSDTGLTAAPPMLAKAAYAESAPELELDPAPQPVHAAVEARFTISEPVLG
ncbi:SIMPL domain-containing protein [Micromonospora sp. WMMD1128]|uniref:SIMPL domain-containing protein n=1 Tax=Micromonospora sp. WMMD1128 TaxID=3015150 RepID=UPI00248D0BB7|nr:SIMPL domain-containing protein [Micromonospora sp. WMMD1128]WBB74611.1 SIMPL domain-containing protein [Micromonospora sp. WMMD1128]